MAYESTHKKETKVLSYHFRLLLKSTTGIFNTICVANAMQMENHHQGGGPFMSGCRGAGLIPFRGISELNMIIILATIIKQK